MKNTYMPNKSEILKITKLTDIEYTFRMAFDGEVKPGQFFEVSIPKYGECPISISEIGDGYLDFTIRRVGKVTDEIHKFEVGDSFFIRGPYGNGFDLANFENKELIVVSGGSGIAPVKPIIDYAVENKEFTKDFNLIAGFKSPEDILFRDNIEKWIKDSKITLTVDKAEEEYKGNTGLVTEYVDSIKIEDIKEAVVVVVGPPMMMKFTVQAFLKRGILEKNVWVSYERKMHCGLGKCGHCKMDDTYICVEGPVFNFEKAKELFD